MSFSISGSGSFDPSKMMAQMRQKMFQEADADGDGKLTKAELKGAMDAHAKDAPQGAPKMDVDKIFDTLDTNKDSSISSAESQAEPKKPQKLDDSVSAFMLQIQDLLGHAGQSDGNGGQDGGISPLQMFGNQKSGGTGGVDIMSLFDTSSSDDKKDDTSTSSKKASSTADTYKSIEDMLNKILEAAKADKKTPTVA